MPLPLSLQGSSTGMHRRQSTNLTISGVTRYPEAAYGMYRTHIDAFCYATIKGETVFAQAESYEDVMLDSITLPFSSPPLVFSPATKMSPDQATSLLKKLGDGASMKAVGKTPECTITKPIIADIPKYLRASNPNFAVGSDRLSPLGFRAYVTAASREEEEPLRKKRKDVGTPATSVDDILTLW